MPRHNEMSRRTECPVGMFASDLKERSLRWSSLSVDEIHDRALILAHYSGVRLRNEIANGGRVPVIPPRHAAPVIQTLLHDGPFAIRGHHETMQVDLKSIGDSVVVDARGEPAGADQGFAIKAATLGNQSQFIRRIAREPAA